MTTTPEDMEERLCTCGAGHGSLEGHMTWCAWLEAQPHEAKELDPAALAKALAAYRITAAYSIVPANHEEALTAAIRSYLEALSTAPVALEPDRDSVRIARLFADMYRSGAQGSDMDNDAAQALALSIDDILSAIHPAPSREAVIEAHRREEPISPALQSVIDGTNAKIRAAFAPSLGEARLAEGEAVAWRYRYKTDRTGDDWGDWITVDVDPNDWDWAPAWHDFECQPLYAHPSHVQAEAGE